MTHLDSLAPRPPSASQSAGVEVPMSPFSRLPTRIASVSLALILLSRVLLAVFGVSLAGDDGDRYLQEGINLSTFGVFSSEIGPSPAPTAHDLPLYPTLLAGIHWFTGQATATARTASIINAFLFTLAAAGVYQIGLRLVADQRAALIALWVFAVIPESIPYSVFYMPESIFLAFFIWSQYFLIHLIQSGDLRALLASFSLLGLSILTKPITVLYPIFAGLLILFFCRRLQMGRRVASALAGIVLVAIALSPWVQRNWTVFHAASLSTITGTNLFDYNYRFILEDRHGQQAWEILEQQRKDILASVEGQASNPFVRSYALGAAAKRGIMDHWQDYLISTLKRHPRLYIGTGNIALLKLIGSPTGSVAYNQVASAGVYPSVSGLPANFLIAQVGAWLILFLIYTLTGIGLLTLLQRKHWLVLVLLGGSFAYFALLIGPVAVTRYRLAMSLYFAIAAGIGWLRISRYITKHGKSRNQPLT